MTLTRTMTSALAVSASYRSARRPSPVDPKLLVGAGLFVLVLIADAVLIALAAPGVADLASLYASTT